MLVEVRAEDEDVCWRLRDRNWVRAMEVMIPLRVGVRAGVQSSAGNVVPVRLGWFRVTWILFLSPHEPGWGGMWPLLIRALVPAAADLQPGVGGGCCAFAGLIYHSSGQQLLPSLARACTGSHG